MVGILQIYLQMCMKKVNAEKIIFDKFLQGLDLHIAGGIL